MKQLRFSSFRQRLNAAFLAVSLVPVLRRACARCDAARRVRIARRRKAGGIRRNGGGTVSESSH